MYRGSVIEVIPVSEPSPELLSAITALYRAAGWWGDEPDDPGGLARMIAGSHVFVVAREDGRVVGMGRALSDRVSDAYIQDLTVLEDCRGRGIATAMIERLIARLRADGLHWISVIAEAGSHPLYEALGFAPMDNATPMLKLDE